MDIIPYTQEQFNAEYYGGGARGGFTKYEWDDPEQQKQLALKWDACHWHGDFRTILFVGCAKGFEVLYFFQRGKAPKGVDISQYAIDNCVPGVASLCRVFDGAQLHHERDSSIDVVAAFDVLTLVPPGMIHDLCAEMVRVAKDKIVVRTIVKNWRNMDEAWDGVDGVSYKYRTFNFWDRLFTESGKFKLAECRMHHQYECVIVWVRV